MPGKSERQRKLARERLVRQQARREHRARRAQVWTTITVVIVVIIGLGVGGFFVFRSGNTKATAASATATPRATTTPLATHCTYTSNPPAARSVGLPPATPDSTAAYQATIVTNRGDRMSARFLVMGNGPLHRPKLPGIPGIEGFTGHAFHTSRWDYSYTGGDSNGGLQGLADRRVGIIGTGATAVQVVPHVAAAAGELT